MVLLPVFILLIPVLPGVTQAEVKVQYAVPSSKDAPSPKPEEKKPSKQPVLPPHVKMAPQLPPPSANMLTDSDRKIAEKMNLAYAQHLYVSTCFNSKKSLLTPDSTKKRAAFTENQLLKACGCMADSLIKDFSANGVINFVSKAYGGTDQKVGRSVMPPGVTPPKKGENRNNPETLRKWNAAMPEFSKIVIARNDDKREKKCGFTP